MALIDCPECEKEVSDKAPSCPHCGIVMSENTAPASLAALGKTNTEKLTGCVWGVLKFTLFLSIISAIVFLPTAIIGEIIDMIGWPEELVIPIFIIVGCWGGWRLGRVVWRRMYHKD